MKPRRVPSSPIPHTGKHDFLHALHDLLRPARYLEIGVQFGNSLWLAREETVCVGVDPKPMCEVPGNAVLFPQESKLFFAQRDPSFFAGPFDLAFIDGSHLVEDALDDFIGVEAHARPDGRTVAVFDDVLPYSADIAGRTPLPGDWAGDVWKIADMLERWRPGLTLIHVDVAPTGVLVVLDLDPLDRVLADRFADIVTVFGHDFGPAPTETCLSLIRTQAVQPAEALDLIRTHLGLTW